MFQEISRTRSKNNNIKMRGVRLDQVAFISGSGIITGGIMEVITTVWNYEESVKRIKPKIFKLKNLTLEVYQELWTARDELSRQGARTDLVANATKSWGDYCEDIGINRSTAHRWLERYDPENMRLLENKAHVSYNTGKYEWYTPQEYIDSAVNVMGNIDVDPASSCAANVIINANTYFTHMKITGLIKNGSGVFG